MGKGKGIKDQTPRLKNERKGLGIKALEILNFSDPGIFSAITMANNTFCDLFGSWIVYARFCLSQNKKQTIKMSSRVFAANFSEAKSGCWSNLRFSMFDADN